MQEAFDRVASDDKQDGQSLKASHFGRFYAEVLFRHFDADNSGTLGLAGVQKAMAFLTKPGQPSAGRRVPASCRSRRARSICPSDGSGPGRDGLGRSASLSGVRFAVRMRVSE